MSRSDINFVAKVANAKAAGAAAIVVFINVPGAYQASLGAAGPQLPAVSISEEDGQALVALAQQGTAAVHLAEGGPVVAEWSGSVVAKTVGSPCQIVIGTNYDTAPSYDAEPASIGANGNASGLAVVLEIARVLAIRNEANGAWFVLFGANQARLVGSKAYFASLPDGQRRNLKAMLDFDAVGAGGQPWRVVGRTSRSTGGFAITRIGRVRSRGDQ